MTVGEDPATSGTQTTDPAATGSTQNGSATPAEKTLPQSEVNRIVAREVAKARAGYEALTKEHQDLASRVAEYEQRAKEAEESKLTAAQRAELTMKREREKLEGERDAARKAAEGERARRHQFMKAHAAASHVGRIASKLFNAEVAPDLEAIVSNALAVEDDGQGGERLMIRLGTDPADVEALTAETFGRFADARLARYFATATGSGHPAGRGANGKGPVVPTNASPQDKIRIGLEARSAKR